MLNKTRCPTALLEPIIQHALRAIGADNNVRIEIRQRRTPYIKGLAIRNPDGIDLIRIWLPRKGGDALQQACIFWEIAAHEFGHLLDYQAMRKGEVRAFTYYRNETSMRAINHDDRPQEVRADRYVQEAKEQIKSGILSSCDNDLLNLAIWLEQQ